MSNEKEEIAGQLHRQDVIERAVKDYEAGKFNPSNGNIMTSAGFGSKQDNKDYHTYEDAWRAARDRKR
jgi:hypothetical protein